jgi:hypothetical protein
MRLRAESLVMTLALAAAACSGEATPPAESIVAEQGADTPIEAVDGLVRAINEPDFVAASRLAVPGQAALASLAEGATFGAVAEALRQGDEEVAANFWSGFAQGAASFLTGDVEVTEDGTFTQDDLQFHQLAVTPTAGESRSLLVRNADGYRVDLFASFGAGLSDKMIAPVERLLVTQTDDARLILTRLQSIVPSLLAAARLPGTRRRVPATPCPG